MKVAFGPVIKGDKGVSKGVLESCTAGKKLARGTNIRVLIIDNYMKQTKRLVAG